VPRTTSTAEFALTELEQVFQRQVDAFNAHDLESFLACYGDDAVILGGRPGDEIVGADAMRRSYTRRLAEPGLHCDVREAVTMGECWLVAHEFVTSGGTTTEVVALFEIRGGLIVRSTSLRS
jgi:hypothetical protein